MDYHSKGNRKSFTTSAMSDLEKMNNTRLLHSLDSVKEEGGGGAGEEEEEEEEEEEALRKA